MSTRQPRSPRGIQIPQPFVTEKKKKSGFECSMGPFIPCVPWTPPTEYNCSELNKNEYKKEKQVHCEPSGEYCFNVCREWSCSNYPFIVIPQLCSPKKRFSNTFSTSLGDRRPCLQPAYCHVIHFTVSPPIPCTLQLSITTCHFPTHNRQRKRKASTNDKQPVSPRIPLHYLFIFPHFFSLPLSTFSTVSVLSSLRACSSISLPSNRAVNTSTCRRHKSIVATFQQPSRS